MDLQLNKLKQTKTLIAVPKIVFFWTEVSGVNPLKCWSHSPGLGVTAPSAPTTTGTTDAFMPNILSSSLGFCFF